MESATCALASGFRDRTRFSGVASEHGTLAESFYDHPCTIETTSTTLCKPRANLDAYPFANRQADFHAFENANGRSNPN